jgi:hypothetical protein
MKKSGKRGRRHVTITHINGVELRDCTDVLDGSVPSTYYARVHGKSWQDVLAFLVREAHGKYSAGHVRAFGCRLDGTKSVSNQIASWAWEVWLLDRPWVI